MFVPKIRIVPWNVLPFAVQTLNLERYARTMAATSLTMLASKFRGCMIGSLMGDCLGAPFEGDFPVSKTILRRYMLRMRESSDTAGTVQVQPYTDDTAMTFSVAKSLIENKKFEPKDMAKRFVVEYYNKPTRGYGMNIENVFDALRKTEYADVFSIAKQQFQGSGSYGNGAAMRIAPTALFGYHKDEKYLKELAEGCSLITHAHQNGYNGAVLQCLAVHEALKLDSSTELDPKEFVSTLLNKMEEIEKELSVSSLEKKRPYCDALEKVKSIFVKQQEDMPEDEISAYLGNSVRAHESVPTAIYSFLRGLTPLPTFESDNPFERTLYFAISVGGDTDTIASMAASISGAYHGVDIIPKSFQDRCEALNESIELADKLYELSQRQKE